MKNRFSKILGIVLALTVLAGLLIVVSPASPVSAGSMAWTAVSSPSDIPFNVLNAGNNWLVDVGTDGKTIFAYDNTNSKLYRSTNGGSTFSSTGLGTNLPGGPMVSLAISSAYANDATVVIANAGTVYRSVNNGSSFGAMPAYAGVTQIRSVDVGPHYAGGQAILIGGVGGGARLSTSTLAWEPLKFTAGAELFAVTFSPTHLLYAFFLGVSFVAGA